MLAEQNLYTLTGKDHSNILAALVEYAYCIGRQLSVNDIGRATVLEAKRIFDARAAWVLLYDAGEDLLEMCSYLGPDEQAFKNITVQVGVGDSGKVFLTQEPRVVLEPGKHSASMFHKRALDIPMPAVAIYPLSTRENRIGVVGISSDKIKPLDAERDEFDPIAAFAQLSAIALHNAIVFDGKREAERELISSVKSLQLLNEIGIDLVSDFDLAAIISKVARYTAEMLGADAAVINLAGDGDTGVRSVYVYNMPPETEQILLEKGTIARTVLEQPHRVLVNDYPSYPGAIERFVEAGLQCVIMVPVSSKGATLATLSALGFKGGRVFSEGDFEKLEFVARQVAIAIENATLYHAQIKAGKNLEAYANRLRLLNELSQAISGEKDRQGMAEQLAHGARVLLDCAAAHVMLYKDLNDNELTMFWTTDASGLNKMIGPKLDLKFHDGLYGEIFRTKKPLRIYNVAEHPRSKGVPEGHIPLRGLLSSPLIDSSGNFIGHVMVTDKRDKTAFTGTDEELLVALCNQAATSIEKAEAYEWQHRIAEALQQAILAVPKSPEGIDVGITYESATEAAKVGGDFYDIFELSDGKIGILIGDVSGKGLEAATITSMVKSTIRAFAYKGLSPATVLTEANRVICEQLKLSNFVTAVYGMLDPATGMLVTSRAGHPEAIIMRDGQCVTFETQSNLPLGVFSDIVFEENRIVLRTGDLILLYTDGLTEARCDGTLLGEELLVEKLHKVMQDSPQQITSKMVGIAREFAGGSLQDDIAVVALRLH